MYTHTYLYVCVYVHTKTRARGYQTHVQCPRWILGLGLTALGVWMFEKGLKFTWLRPPFVKPKTQLKSLKWGNSC